MVSILGSSASGLAHNQFVLDVVGNNIANVDTFGFKKFRAVAEGRPDAAATPESSRLGVAESTNDLVFSPAAPQADDNPLHFSIQDDTFFKVLDSDGSTAYTRFGQLSVDSAGNITAYGGRLLDPPQSLPPDLLQPSMSPSGEITAVDAQGARQVVGQLNTYRFMNPQGLQTIGDGLYRETANSGDVTEGTPGVDGFAELVPGTLEGSNVDVAEEFTNMIIAQRAYSACAKTFSVGDQMLELATNLTQ